MITTLSTDKVSKIYGQGESAVLAVDQVDFEIHSGEFVALVGPSGSGKTTLLAMLAALLSPSDGCVRIDSQKLCDMNELERTYFRRQKIGFTFQFNNLIPYLTALENVELMLRLNNTLNNNGRDHARELLVRLGLEDKLHNMPNQLSGGQQQRVAIARSLVHSPAVVLADEPTANLDTVRAFQVVETFADLIHEQKRAGIMVTHDLRMVKFVDKVIHMVDGKMQQILTRPKEISQLAEAGVFPESPEKNKTAKKSSGRRTEMGRQGTNLVSLTSTT